MSLRLAPLVGALLFAAPASASLPEPVRAMIEAAIATGDAGKVGTVVDIAKATHPADTAEIDALREAFLTRQHKSAVEEQARRDAELRSAGLLDNWGGTGQIGAFQSSGNSDNVGVTLSLALNRTGVDWQHRLRAAADYQRSNGRTSREQYFASWEPRYQVNGDLFSYALAQYENDRFQGFSSRYSLSGGLGYKVFDDDALRLTVKAGPSWRSVEYLDGTDESSFGGLAGMDFGWQIAKSLKLTQDANMVADSGGEATVIVDSISTSVLATTGLEAKISDGLTTRVSYTVDYNSNPPVGAVSTDTQTRFSLVYGF